MSEESLYRKFSTWAWLKKKNQNQKKFDWTSIFSIMKNNSDFQSSSSSNHWVQKTEFSPYCRWLAWWEFHLKFSEIPKLYASIPEKDLRQYVYKFYQFTGKFYFSELWILMKFSKVKKRKSFFWFSEKLQLEFFWNFRIFFLIVQIIFTC